LGEEVGVGTATLVVVEVPVEEEETTLAEVRVLVGRALMAAATMVEEEEQEARIPAVLREVWGHITASPGSQFHMLEVVVAEVVLAGTRLVVLVEVEVNMVARAHLTQVVAEGIVVVVVVLACSF